MGETTTTIILAIADHPGLLQFFADLQTAVGPITAHKARNNQRGNPINEGIFSNVLGAPFSNTSRIFDGATNTSQYACHNRTLPLNACFKKLGINDIAAIISFINYEASGLNLRSFGKNKLSHSWI